MNEAELKQTLSKEKNFVSAVVYLRPGRENAEGALGFFGKLAAELEAHFAQYEIVAVDDAAPAGVVAALRSWAADCPKPLTILHMGLRQGLEAGMNAGLDAAIGDYVYEFDSTEMPYDPALIFRAYETATLYRSARPAPAVRACCSTKFSTQTPTGRGGCAPMRSGWSAAGRSTGCMPPARTCLTARRLMRQAALRWQTWSLTAG